MKTTLKILFFMYLGCFCMPTVYGFTVDNLQYLPDTFHITEADIEYYDDISFIRENIRDSIENPKAYLFTNGDDDYSDAFVAVKTGNKYIVFNATKDWGIRNFHFERKNINNTGSEELIIHWSESNGRGYQTHGFSFIRAGICIWDLDSYTCLFSLQIHESSDEYYQSYDEETDTYGEDSVYEEWCEHYSVEFEEMQMTIQLTQQTYDNECINVKGDKHIYKLTESGFVLDRKEVGDLDNK